MEKNQTTSQDSRLLIKFAIDDESFGVNIANIREIVEIPSITSVPKTPDYFAGIINLRGDVISVIDMRIRFGLPQKDFDELSRIAVTYFKGGLIGMIVDDVNEVVRIREDRISSTPSILKNINTKYLDGVVKTDSGSTLLLLNLKEIIKLDEFAVEMEKREFERKDLVYEEKVEKKEPDLQLITFYLEDELYAINIQDADEIVTIPEIIPIPQASDFIKGVISLRGDVIPVVDLHVRFNYDELEIDKDTSIIIVEVEGCKIGLMIDAISEIKRVLKSAITTPPPTLSKLDLSQLHGIIKGADGDDSRIISYLSLPKLFTGEELRSLSEVSDEDKTGGKTKQKALKDESEVVVDFKVAEDIFTIPVYEIVEIIKIPELTYVPNAPSFIEGVINLRGEVVYVIDMRARFGFERKGIDESTRVIIADIEGIKTGLIVDEVDMVKTIFKSQIEPAPSIITSIENDYISSVVKIKDSDEIMIMLNLFSLLNTAEIEALKRAEKESAKEADSESREKKKSAKPKKSKKKVEAKMKETKASEGSNEPNEPEGSEDKNSKEEK